MNLASKFECSIFVSRYGTFLRFSKKKKFQFEVSQNFEVPNPVVGYCCEYSRELRIVRLNATAHLLFIRDVTFFSYFKNIQRTSQNCMVFQILI